MKKRISLIALLLSALMLLSVVPVMPVLAAPDVTVILDGKTLAFDVPPQIVNDRTLVPLRAIFEA